MLCECDELGDRVRDFGTLDELVKGMKKITGMMDKEERRKVMWSEDFLHKLDGLDESRDSYMKGLPEILDMFGVGSGDDDSDKDGEDFYARGVPGDSARESVPFARAPGKTSVGKPTAPKRREPEVINLS